MYLKWMKINLQATHGFIATTKRTWIVLRRSNLAVLLGVPVANPVQVNATCGCLYWSATQNSTTWLRTLRNLFLKLDPSYVWIQTEVLGLCLVLGNASLQSWSSIISQLLWLFVSIEEVTDQSADVQSFCWIHLQKVYYDHDFVVCTNSVDRIKSIIVEF